MKHFFVILLSIVVILLGMYLPYTHGDYDYFAVGLLNRKKIKNSFYAAVAPYYILDEQAMTVYNQDLLRIHYDSILHGYHNVEQLPNPHWKIYYFD